MLFGNEYVLNKKFVRTLLGTVLNRFFLSMDWNMVNALGVLLAVIPGICCAVLVRADVREMEEFLPVQHLLCAARTDAGPFACDNDPWLLSHFAGLSPLSLTSSLIVPIYYMCPALMTYPLLFNAVPSNRANINHHFCRENKVRPLFCT